MQATGRKPSVLLGRGIGETFRRDTGGTIAIDGVSLEAQRHAHRFGEDRTARRAAGLAAGLTASAGELTVVGVDVATDPQQGNRHRIYAAEVDLYMKK